MTGVRWAFDISTWKVTQKDWGRAMMCVGIAERARIRQFKYLSDAKASLAGLLMVRRLMKRIGEEAAEVRRSPRGRPYLANRKFASQWDFNISHHGRFAVLAAERGKTLSKCYKNRQRSA